MILRRNSGLLPVFAIACFLICALTIGVVAPAPSSAKTQPAVKDSIPRTADGRPDLQGIWSFATITPLERPPELADKEFFASDKEAADYEADVRKRTNADRRDGPAEQDVGRAYNDFW